MAVSGQIGRDVALFALLAILIFVLYQDRDRNRFVNASENTSVLDTRTGQCCDPWPREFPNIRNLPECCDLSERWR
jgi:hypothetical protein